MIIGVDYPPAWPPLGLETAGRPSWWPNFRSTHVCSYTIRITGSSLLPPLFLSLFLSLRRNVHTASSPYAARSSSINQREISRIMEPVYSNSNYWNRFRRLENRLELERWIGNAHYDIPLSRHSISRFLDFARLVTILLYSCIERMERRTGWNHSIDDRRKYKSISIRDETKFWYL